MRRVPGLTVLAAAVGTGPRGMIDLSGTRFVAYQGKIVRVLADGTKQDLTGALPGTDGVTFARNNRVTAGASTPDLVAVREGGGAYVVDLVALTVAPYADADLTRTATASIAMAARSGIAGGAGSVTRFSRLAPGWPSIPTEPDHLHAADDASARPVSARLLDHPRRDWEGPAGVRWRLPDQRRQSLMPDVIVTTRGPTNLRMRFRPGLVGPQGSLTPGNIVATIEALFTSGAIPTARPSVPGKLYANGDPVNGYALYISGTAP